MKEFRGWNRTQHGRLAILKRPTAHWLRIRWSVHPKGRSGRSRGENRLTLPIDRGILSLIRNHSTARESRLYAVRPVNGPSCVGVIFVYRTSHVPTTCPSLCRSLSASNLAVSTVEQVGSKERVSCQQNYGILY
jgi:hypothetical protein